MIDEVEQKEKLIKRSKYVWKLILKITHIYFLISIKVWVFIRMNIDVKRMKISALKIGKFSLVSWFLVFLFLCCLVAVSLSLIQRFVCFVVLIWESQKIHSSFNPFSLLFPFYFSRFSAFGLTDRKVNRKQEENVKFFNYIMSRLLREDIRWSSSR